MPGVDRSLHYVITQRRLRVKAARQRIAKGTHSTAGVRQQPCWELGAGSWELGAGSSDLLRFLFIRVPGSQGHVGVTGRVFGVL